MTIILGNKENERSYFAEYQHTTKEVTIGATIGATNGALQLMETKSTFHATHIVVLGPSASLP